jgi:trimethylamine--corrinoid protein Co-methyltransferase
MTAPDRSGGAVPERAHAHADLHRVGPHRRLTVLTDTEVARIHETSLDILADVGVMFHSQRALDVLAEHGADVDRETTVARIPASAVETALATLPHDFVLGGREPAFDLPLDGDHAYLSVDGCAVFVRGSDGTVRPSAKADVAAAAHVAEGLDGLSMTSAIVSAQDCSEKTRVLHEFDACVRHSRKHAIVVSIKEDREARSLIRMAEAVQGGSAELAARPLFTCILCTVSPLHQERFGMDLAFTLAEAGIPFMLYPMPILGATAPVTPAGTAVVNNTEILAAIVATQLAVPGAKTVHAGGPTSLDMRSGSYFASVPESVLLRAVQAQMAQFYGLPAGLGYGGTKAKEPEPQSAWENAFTMALEFFAGADFIFGAGLLDGSQIHALEQFVIDDEVFGMVERLLRGVEIDDDHLAAGLIARMGFKGEYLFDSHTRAHVRELWRARLGETGSYEAWRTAGAPSTVERARARVDELLAAEPVGFADDLGREFDDIIAAAEEERT